MKIAIISVIHDNISALEAVLADLERQGNADQVVVTGDMFTFGPAPDQVLARIRQLPHTHFLMGNTDRYLLERTYPALRSGGDSQDQLLLSFHWTAQQLGNEGFDFLKSLAPFSVIQDKRRQLLADAMVGVLGMLLGAGVYVAAYPALQPLIRALGDRGKVTLPEITGASLGSGLRR